MTPAWCHNTPLLTALFYQGGCSQEGQGKPWLAPSEALSPPPLPRRSASIITESGVPRTTAPEDMPAFSQAVGGRTKPRVAQAAGPHQQSPTQLSHSIQWKELYPIVLVAYIWSTLRIRLLCDNQAVVHCIVTGTSRCPHLMSLLRNLFLLAARHNFNISAQHIQGIHNNIADLLSCFLMQDFRTQAPLASPHPCPIPLSLPLERI